jgi:hypothetical protein
VSDSGLRRIAFVTRHYSSLRHGVARAIFATVLIGALVIELVLDGLLPRGGWRAIVGLANICSMAAVGMLLCVLARRWMDRRFGRAGTSSPLRSAMEINIWMVAYFVAVRLDSHLGYELPSFGFLVVAAYGLWVWVRLWPAGVHYLLPTAVALAFALIHADLRDGAAVDTWELQAYGVTLLAWTAAGMIDCALLLKLLPGRHSEELHADA